ncbi:MAG: ABC transporter permease subunit [Gammaproteobacteria bacterium]|nr:ABC transporter permease subunit [Gammaproteobacteria bacterium]
MLLYTFKRILQTIPVLLGVSVIVFLTMALIPGDPAEALLGAYATPENVARIKAQLGLDESLPERYLIWLGNVLRGDFARSYSLDRAVLDVVLERLGPTLLLAGTSLVLAAIAGLLAGTFAAVKQYGWQDRVVTLLVIIGISTPPFWLGLVLILVFAVMLGWFPVSGMFAVYGGGGILDVAHHLVLPALALASVVAGILGRLMRTYMLEVLREDHIRTARAMGLPERRVIYRHAFKSALVAIVPVIAMQVGFLLGGAVYIETVFQWPGIGRMLVTAVSSRDVLLVQGGVLVVAACYVLLNLAADILQQALDPRIRA